MCFACWFFNSPDDNNQKNHQHNNTAQDGDYDDSMLIGSHMSCFEDCGVIPINNKLKSRQQHQKHRYYCVKCKRRCTPRRRLLCGCCFRVMYCSRECQRRDWPAHSIGCSVTSFIGNQSRFSEMPSTHCSPVFVSTRGTSMAALPIIFGGERGPNEDMVVAFITIIDPSGNGPLRSKETDNACWNLVSRVSKMRDLTLAQSILGETTFYMERLFGGPTHCCCSTGVITWTTGNRSLMITMSGPEMVVAEISPSGSISFPPINATSEERRLYVEYARTLNESISLSIALCFDGNSLVNPRIVFGPITFDENRMRIAPGFQSFF